MKTIVIIILISLLMGCAQKPTQVNGNTFELISMNKDGEGEPITLTFTKGKQHNHPLMAIWIENADGKYLQTLYVSQSIGKGIYPHGTTASGRWEPGEQRRPASLPYWAFKRGVKEADGLYIPTSKTPIVDAYTGPTPKANFILDANSDKMLPRQFKILFEINQSWDWNEYWTNAMYPNEPEYKTSSQPAIIYSVNIDLDNPSQEYSLIPIGHSHYSGADGKLYTDLSTLTTAKQIAKKITVKIGR